MKSSYKKINFLKNTPTKIRFSYCGTIEHRDEKKHELMQKRIEQQVNIKLEQQSLQQGENFEKLCSKIQTSYDHFMEDFQNQLPDYLMHLLEILLPKIKIERETLLELIQQLLASNVSEGPLTLCISLADQTMIDDLQKHFTNKYPQLKITTDPSLQAGDMILKTDFGILDNRLKSRLKTLQTCFDHCC